MQKLILLNLFGILTILCISCSPLKVSKYSAYNQFKYLEEQPRFNFQNETLGIEGAWNWASSARSIPKISYLPKTPLQIIKSLSKRKERVLFATWVPIRKKYDTSEDVEVRKKDVQYIDKFNKLFFIILLINDRPFKADTGKYKPRGKNYDNQFELFATSPELSSSGYWVMETVAASKNRYYDFVCIMDQSHMPDLKVRDYQAQLFLDDIKTRFLTK